MNASSDEWRHGMQTLGMPELAAQCIETAAQNKAQMKQRSETKRSQTVEAVARAQVRV